MDMPISPVLVNAATEVLGTAWPSLVENHEVILGVLTREEAGFDRTLRAGLSRLEEAFATGSKVLGGDVAFTLHDTHGFPVELTEELARDAGVEVDRAGFDAAMEEQRSRARAGARSAKVGDESAYRTLLESEGTTQFVGRSPAHYEVPARIVGLLGAPSDTGDGAGSGEAGSEGSLVEIFLDQTPFYAEGGGQVGDTGTIATETGRADVFDTVYALPGLIVHKARVTGKLALGQDALATIDGPRREAIRRNHTATHLLHAALRKVLGDHVRQQGSEVGPDRLRFDFSHHGQPTTEELDEVFRLANDAVLTDAPVDTTETSLQEAERMGAIAFFGDKYGSTVRVIRAGATSLEFCGGTHVDALGKIGPISLLSEESIGSNKRRIFAVTGRVALDRVTAREHLVKSAADLLRTEPDELLPALERMMARQREAEKELAKLRQKSSESLAAELAQGAEDGVVVARQNALESDALRALAQAVLRHDGVRAVALGGSPDGVKVALVVVTGGEPNATEVVRALGTIVGGGGGGSPELAVAGGKNPARLEDALAEARRLLSA
jgi:alanyl-tRNA synthetase